MYKTLFCRVTTSLIQRMSEKTFWITGKSMTRGNFISKGQKRGIKRKLHQDPKVTHRLEGDYKGSEKHADIC